ncbi:MAG: hypothetical protein CMO74_12775 [Verrucomicrobiales bacterium]|nr:hypothetical protein [Verrucomicrobiales bacterium]|tara:strand:+ start:1907 stop:5635 length:3729 start_codon:yes stop_codon:yes gene_type:complete
MLLVLLTGLNLAQGFVMIGPMHTNRLTALGMDLNYWDDLGGPKERKSFFRWNTPSLVYSFDASFITYFGLEGRFAIKEAFDILNDFFQPVDESYSGMTELDLADHGFLGNYNTTWVNTTAQNQSILDIKSLTLGLLVNQLGLGNPHRYAFSIHDATTNQASTMINFRVRLRNFDPITENPTDMINNVKYSYRLVHDGTNSPGVGNAPFIMPTFADMEEFTTDTSGNAWSSVAAIADAFYGNSLIYWTDKPSLYDFGVYYDGMNAMGGKNQPRHALTYDDAGGLRYLYRNNNYVYETLPLNVVLVVPTQLLPLTAVPVFPGPFGRPYPSSLGGNPNFIPRRNTGYIPALPITSVLPAQGPPPFFDLAMRGGIDKIQFYEQPFDSLLGITFTPTNLTWTDTFVTTNGQNIIGADKTVPGSELFLGVPELKTATQEVGRAVWMPDIIFVADDLGLSPDGVPIGWNRTGPGTWIDNFTNTLGPTPTFDTNVGPGVITGPIQFSFTKIHEEFELIWSGEASIVGNQNTYSLWGHIRGPGPKDVVIFPRDVRHAIIENSIAPASDVPKITRVSDDGGTTAISTAYTRTTETLTLIGQRLASVRVIQILNGNVVVQSIAPATEYVISDSRLDIPVGIISDAAEGTDREIRVWSTLGYSEKGPQKFTIETGNPVLTGTNADGLVYNRAEPLLIQGYGFKSVDVNATKIAYVRIDDASGNAVWPTDGNVTSVTLDVKSDTLAELSRDMVSSIADGSNRRLRLSRIDNNTQLSSTNDVRLISAISAKPEITSYTTEGMAANSGEYRRDKTLDINGTALNTTYRIEIIKADGTSYSPALALDLPHPGVYVEDNGSRIQLSADVFTSAAADSNSSDDTHEFKIFNAINNTDQNASFRFNVNRQPFINFIGAFSSTGAFNRDKTVGDDIFIAGTGLKSVGRIHLIDANGSGLNSSIEANATGVTLTDASIIIDTSVIQFSNPGNADSVGTQQFRLFSLESARDNATSPAAQRFHIGTPPTFSTLSGLTSNHYRRDSDTLEFNGTGLGMVTKVEIVDAAGQPISGLNAINTSGGVTIVDGTSFTITADAPGWRPTLHLADSIGSLSRRLKVTTPYGTATTDTNASGAFTVSGTPSFFGVSQATFAGGGYDGGTSTAGTYDLSSGPLHINGRNFRGVKQIVLEDNASTTYATINVNADAPPQGININADGTLITITGATISSHNATWAANDSSLMKRVTLISVADQNGTTQDINTQP